MNLHEHKNAIFFWVLGIAIALSVSITYYRYIVRMDYMVLLELSCDPAVESCYKYECDPEWDECTGNVEDDIWYYKILEKKAYALKECSADVEECPEARCADGEEDCVETQCDVSDEVSGGECYGPGLDVEE